MKNIFSILVLFVGLSVVTFGQVSPKTKINLTGTKELLIKKLVKQTNSMFPAEDIKIFLNSFYEKVKSEMDEDFEQILKTVVDSLEKDKTLSPDQRLFLSQTIKQKLPEVKMKSYDELKKWMLKEVFVIEPLIDESLNNVYQNSFSTSELKILNQYFSKSKGKSLIKKIRLIVLASMNSGNQTKSTEDLLKDDFNKTKLGAKFIDCVKEKFSSELSMRVDNLAEKASKDASPKFIEAIKHAILEILFQETSGKKSTTIGAF